MMLLKISLSLLSLRLCSAIASPRQDIPTTIIEAIESATTCAACDSLLVLLQGVAHLGNDAFVDTISEVCIETGAEDPDVCKGAIAREGSILAHDLREMTIPSHTAQLFCTTIFGLCDYPAVTPNTISFPSPKPVANRPVPSSQTPIQIVHISDIHVDLSYEVGANYNCTKNICCRPYTSADAPGNNSYPAGPNGEHTCDSPASLEESLYNAIETIAPDAAFTMITGDIVEGAVWLTTQDEVTNDLQDAYGRMSGLKLVYGTVGNHDSNPVNSFPPAAVSTTLTSQWVYDTLSSLWITWIGSSAAAVADTNPGAYSTAYPSNTTGKLRVISINTNMYYKENFWLYETTMEQDPSGQLAWLVKELQAAEDAGERVYILGHMPMGSGDALHDGSNYFDQIINRYEATIAALFFGHTHKDEFELSYSSYTSQSPTAASAISYIAPALTPTSGNPAFRIYTVDPATWAVLDLTTYIANLSSPTYQTSGLIWTEYYSAKAAYGPLVSPHLTSEVNAEMSPAFWHNVTVAWASNQTAFDEYYARKSREWNVASCTGDCVASEICQLRAARSQDNCVVVTPGIDFRKRDVGWQGANKASECGGSAMGRLVGKVRGRL